MIIKYQIAKCNDNKIIFITYLLLLKFFFGLCVSRVFPKFFKRYHIYLSFSNFSTTTVCIQVPIMGTYLCIIYLGSTLQGSPKIPNNTIIIDINFYFVNAQGGCIILVLQHENVHNNIIWLFIIYTLFRGHSSAVVIW